MASMDTLTAEQIMDTDPVTTDIGKRLSQVRHTMETNRVRTIPVLDGDRFTGMLSYRDVMEKLRADPSTTKVEGLLHTPPTVEPDDTLVELAELRIESGRKTFVLLDENDHLRGVVGERELAAAARGTDELQGVTVADLMTGADALLTIAPDIPVETARKRMADADVSRLVVVEDGSFAGLISSLDALRAMVPRDQMEGGSANAARQGTAPSASGDRKGEKHSLSDVPVRELMQAADTVDAEILRDADSPLPAAIDTMVDGGALEVVVLDGDRPVGLLTLKDVVDFVRGQAGVDSMLVKLTGPEVPEEKQVIHSKIETQMQGGLGRVLDRPDELKVHMKKYEADGSRHKYTLNFNLSSELGTTRVNTHAWELLDAVDEGLDTLERLVREEKEKVRDEQRSRERKGKYTRS